MSNEMVQFEDPRLPGRFWDKVSPCPMSGCWLWTAATNNGYGIFFPGRRIAGTPLAHRLSYLILVAQIPDDLELDHLCRVRCCVNPAHLEPVTKRVNVQRGESWKTNGLKTHCDHGHALTGDNVRINRRRDGEERSCKTCDALNARKYREKMRKQSDSAVRLRAAIDYLRRKIDGYETTFEIAEEIVAGTVSEDGMHRISALSRASTTEEKDSTATDRGER